MVWPINSVLVLFLVSSTILRSMEQSEHCTIPEFKKDVILNLNNQPIKLVQFQGNNLLRLMFRENDYHCTFFIHRDRENKLYLNPIIPENESLEQMNLDYSLLDAIERGDIDTCRQLKNEANFSVLDARLKFISPFNIIRRSDQKICSSEDIVAGEAFTLQISQKPAVYCWPYADSSNFSIIQQLERNYNYHILRELMCDEKLYTFEMNQTKLLEITGFLKVVQAEEKELPFMQALIRLLTDEKSLDQLCICRLGKLYAKIIAQQDSKGKQLISQIHDWKKYQILRGHILHSLSEMVRMQPYQEAQLIPSNFVELSKRIMQDELFLESVKSKEFFSNVLSYSKLYGVDGQHKEWSAIYYHMLALLLKNEEGKIFLKELCNNKNNENLFSSTIKPFMQNALFRKFVVRQLVCANPPLNEHVAPLVSEHWQPDEKFINYFKALKISKRMANKIIEIETKKFKKQ
ncbi:MAG: hypothetical protein BWY54_00084 [Candidatus Dependentiae bacterium ADurb.Bin331]|nr:MAG: hypothetical protein BWY54_00084 [Candidatus Dependentiae bacterium ADurb.Bin331]